MGKKKGACRVLDGKSEVRRPLVKPKRRCDDNIKMNLLAVGLGAWSGSIWLRIGTDGVLV